MKSLTFWFTAVSLHCQERLFVLAPLQGDGRVLPSLSIMTKEPWFPCESLKCRSDHLPGFLLLVRNLWAQRM